MLLVQKTIHWLQIRWISKGEKHFSAWVNQEGRRVNINLSPCLEASGICVPFTNLPMTHLIIRGPFFPFGCPPSCSCVICLNLGCASRWYMTFTPTYVPRVSQVEHAINWQNHGEVLVTSSFIWSLKSFSWIFPMSFWEKTAIMDGANAIKIMFLC